MSFQPHKKDHTRLDQQCQRLNTAARNHPLHRVQAGPGWIKLLLAGDERLSVLMLAKPGCALELLWQGKLPDPIHALLKPRKDHPLSQLLTGHTLRSCRLLKDDRVICFQFTSPTNQPVALLHQVFGSRGNFALLAQDQRLLWAEHRPPHSLLCRTPTPSDFTPCSNISDPILPFSPDTDTLDDLASFLGKELSQPLLGQLRKRKLAAMKLVDNLAHDLANAVRGDEYRRKAEALAAHLHEISPGQSACDIADPRDGSLLHIDLDPALNPALNLTAWFKKASKADKGRQIIDQRLGDARIELQKVTEDLASLLDILEQNQDPLPTLERLHDWSHTHSDIIDRKGRKKKPGHSPYAPDQPARPFRRYCIEDKWEVWVGRSSKENDQLTHHSSHVKDIWFHAHGTPGSHVILRTGGKPDQVPQRVIAKAAALAAFHSKAKHSNLVSVIWTERRYVRKPRKSAAGVAVCLREKSIMVTPSFPPDIVAC